MLNRIRAWGCQIPIAIGSEQSGGETRIQGFSGA
jgi:hypothetical protein